MYQSNRRTRSTLPLCNFISTSHMFKHIQIFAWKKKHSSFNAVHNSEKKKLSISVEHSKNQQKKSNRFKRAREEHNEITFKMETTFTFYFLLRK